ncbi:MAG: hypothetical protein AAFP69_12450, partial [Planctomycetota bacterium]
PHDSQRFQQIFDAVLTNAFAGADPATDAALKPLRCRWDWADDAKANLGNQIDQVNNLRGKIIATADVVSWRLLQPMVDSNDVTMEVLFHASLQNEQASSDKTENTNQALTSVMTFVITADGTYVLDKIQLNTDTPWQPDIGRKFDPEFIQKIGEGDLDWINNLFEKDWGNAVHRPTLNAYLQTIQSHYGAFQSIDQHTLDSRVRAEGSSIETIHAGEAVFEKERLPFMLRFDNGQLAQFTLTYDETFSDDHAKSVDDMQLHVKQGEQLMRAILVNEYDDAVNLLPTVMHDGMSDFRSTAMESREKLKKDLGAFRSIDFSGKELDEDADWQLNYVLKYERGAIPAYVTFRTSMYDAEIVKFNYDDETSAGETNTGETDNVAPDGDDDDQP